MGSNNFDAVSRPQHYVDGRRPEHEPIVVIEAWGLGFCLGNCVKYISRAGRKADSIEDLRKARWYLDREIARLKTETKAEIHGRSFCCECRQIVRDILGFPPGDVTT